jgi:hypothetical protein
MSSAMTMMMFGLPAPLALLVIEQSKKGRIR